MICKVLRVWILPELQLAHANVIDETHRLVVIVTTPYRRFPVHGFIRTRHAILTVSYVALPSHRRRQFIHESIPLPHPHPPMCSLVPAGWFFVYLLSFYLKTSREVKVRMRGAS